MAAEDVRRCDNAKTRYCARAGDASHASFVRRRRRFFMMNGGARAHAQWLSLYARRPRNVDSSKERGEARQHRVIAVEGAFTVAHTAGHDNPRRPP